MAISEIEERIVKSLVGAGLDTDDVIGFHYLLKNDEGFQDLLKEYFQNDNFGGLDALQIIIDYLICKYRLKDKRFIPFPLYHGTDERIVSMTAADRLSFKNDVFLAVDYLWSFYEPYYANYEKNEELKQLFADCDDSNLYYNVMNALTVNSARNNGNEKYQYGPDCICVTNNFQRAKNYAYMSFAFGEIGLITYRMIQGLKYLNLTDWSPNDEVRCAIDRIVSFAEADSKPVVYCFQDVFARDLVMEDGKPFDVLRFSGLEMDDSFAFSFRYLKNNDFDLSKENCLDVK